MVQCSMVCISHWMSDRNIPWMILNALDASLNQNQYDQQFPTFHPIPKDTCIQYHLLQLSNEITLLYHVREFANFPLLSLNQATNQSKIFANIHTIQYLH